MYSKAKSNLGHLVVSVVSVISAVSVVSVVASVHSGPRLDISAYSWFSVWSRSSSSNAPG